MYNPEIPEMPFRNEHVTSDFTSVFIATVLGAFIGSRLDRTRFGRWVNESPTANEIFRVLKAIMIFVIVGLVAIFVYCLMTV